MALHPAIKKRLLQAARAADHRGAIYTYGGDDDTPASQPVQARSKGRKLAATRSPYVPHEPPRPKSLDRTASDCVISVALTSKWKSCRGESDWTDLARELMFEAEVIGQSDHEARRAYRFLAHIARYHASTARKVRQALRK
jgi:hypothetical protein